MDPFVRRLVLRMADPTRPLSRNKHFHTFESPEGKAAMKVFRRLTALRKDINACEKAGGTWKVEQHEADGKLKVELTLMSIRARRTVVLEPAELELLNSIG
ncbi:MAG: hypothetical protein JNK82_19065 [Myxococcaceae bacterium]|nr:hypothetical protein [Myxococcaceae bacterium]